jgi:sirohydrochlorin cobaltochelatase
VGDRLQGQSALTDATAVMICGHGSRDDDAVDEFNRLSGHLRKRLPGFDVESGFLEFARPVIREGLEKLKARGAERIVCLPGMLFAAGHVKNDLPSEVHEFAHDNPKIEVVFGRDLAIDARLLEAARDRIEEAERSAAKHIARADTLLMVVGRGTNDPDANSNVAKVARMLWEGMGFGWAEISYSGVAAPLVDAGLAQAVKLGFPRIVVFPYFLFTGLLVRRIYAWTDEAARSHSEIEFLKAPYLNDHARVVDTFVSRIEEALDGDANMNCALCKYRERIVGYEADQGAPQVGHHHHVRGVGTDGSGAADRGVHHGHHRHGHHHHTHGHDHHHDHDHRHGEEDPA